MPVGLEASDRKLLAIGGAVLVLLLGATIFLSPPREELSSPVPSTYSAQPAGAAAAYRLLSRLHFPVRRWEDAPTELPSAPENALFILAEPTQVPTTKERQAVNDFVQNGGRVLFTGPNIQSFFPEVDTSSDSANSDPESFSPAMPSHLDRGAQHITMERKGYWRDLDYSQLALYGDAHSPAVVVWSHGDGEILWWAGSTPLTNSGLTRENNLAFFLNSVSNWLPDEPYQIYWDEYFHGQRSSLWSYAQKTSLAWGLAQIGLLGIAVIFTFSRRNGPVYRPSGISRSSPLEFVDTLGGLYEHAGAASAAVSVSLLRLRHLLTRQLGLAGDTSDAELSRAAEQRLNWKDFQSAQLLGRARAASRLLKMRSREALDLVQELERYAGRLEVRPRNRQGKSQS
jgi:hypothetical protein